MGFLVNLACSLVGNFLILRRMALVGDAISHSVLPGIAIVFLISNSRSTGLMVAGALGAGLLTVWIIEFIHKKTRVKQDAALGVTFTTLFAIGVILIAVFADKVDLDLECVLYGEIGWINFAESVHLLGLDIPIPVLQMTGTVTLVLLLLTFFYKEILVTCFDTGLATSLGIPVKRVHYGLMMLLSLVVVFAFESVGAILVIAMLIMPGTTGALLSDRLPHILLISTMLSAVYALGGLHLAEWLNCSQAGAMVVVGFVLFLVTWTFSPRRGLLFQTLKQMRQTTAPIHRNTQ
ncbi:MAG: metal ABC transporter permease [Verrucomicrobiae bacterium]|nr:metal ABC transporter permease [Verrucomicrobiae bacterium]